MKKVRETDRCRVSSGDGIYRMEICGEIGFEHRTERPRIFRRDIPAGGCLTLDLGAVPLIDSAGIALRVPCKRKREETKRRRKIASPHSSHVVRIFRNSALGRFSDCPGEEVE